MWAIVATVADEFGPLPPMKISRVGLGAGDRDMKEQANLLRLILGESNGHIVSDQVWVLETNLDDISGEIVGHTTTKLLSPAAETVGRYWLLVVNVLTWNSVPSGAPVAS